MSIDKNKGNFTAFPVQDVKHIGAGLSKREYFAGLAMQGIVASSNRRLDTGDQIIIANVSVNMADMLLNSLSIELDDE